MPYIKPEVRLLMEQGHTPDTPGELNYLLTILVGKYLHRGGEAPSYTDFNEVVGVLECMKLELYRRVIAPYENSKKEQNGDVYY